MNKVLLLSISLISFCTYSQKNTSQIDLDSDSFDEFEILEDTLDDYTVYFTGENHMYATFNTQFQVKFLKYLYEKQGVKHFIFEQSPAVGYIVQKATVEDKKWAMEYLRDNFYEPFYKMAKEIARFNEDKAIEDKIIVHGIDVERFPFFSMYALHEMVDTIDKKFPGGEVLEQILALTTSEFEFADAYSFYGEENDGFQTFGFGDVSAWGTLASIIRGAEDHKDSLTAHLGLEAPMFFAILESLNKGREWYVTERKGDVKSPIVRERYMAEEFKRVYDLYPGAKYYGQFGRCHLHKDANAKRCYEYYMNSIANRIGELNSELEGKVLVIPIYYSDSKERDQEIIETLEIKDKYLQEGESHFIDLDYTGGDNPITGFYSDIPFIIVCNEHMDIAQDYSFAWYISLEQYHLNGYYGYSNFPKLKSLNQELAAYGTNGFTKKMLTYQFGFDYYIQNEYGTRGHFTYYPGVSNEDGFTLKGYSIGFGNYLPLGGRWVTVALGWDWSYGVMSLQQRTDNTNPNLIQAGGSNLVTYKNDLLTIDPNIELRLTLPVISLNFKTGFAADISGKYWKLDGKMKDFAKTSFSHPYMMAGISLNMKKEW